MATAAKHSLSWSYCNRHRARERRCQQILAGCDHKAERADLLTASAAKYRSLFTCCNPGARGRLHLAGYLSLKSYPEIAFRIIMDELGRRPILLVLGEDKKSVRAFERNVDGHKFEFFVKPSVLPLRLVDAETGSEWDFGGEAVSGPANGKHLNKIPVLNDYWFDWKTYNPNTTLYQLGNR